MMSINALKNYYEVELNQADPLRCKIESVTSLMLGSHCSLVPLYFADQVPKLGRLDSRNPYTRWCVAYKYPGERRLKNGMKSITTPTYLEYRELLVHSLDKLDGFRSRGLFEGAVRAWVYERSKHFSEFQKRKRFVAVENVHLKCFQYEKDKEILQPHEYIAFLNKMEKRNWYEFIFNEFTPGRY